MLKRQLFSQRGMTLVETMAAAAILGGLAVAGMTLFKNQSTGQKTVEANYEITNLFQQMRVVLSQQGNCTASFGPLNPNGGTTTRLRKDIAGTMTDVYTVNSTISGTLVTVKSYTLEKTAGTGLAANETWLKINFNKGKSTLMENTTKMMKIVYTGGGTIGTCYAYNNSTDTYWLQATPPDIYFNVGRVGIGTAAPVEQLNIAGGNIRINQDAADRYLSFGTTVKVQSSNMGSNLDFAGGSGTLPFRFWSNNFGSILMTVNSSGYLGVGTTAPGEPLSVYNAVGGWNGRFSNNSGTGADVYLAHGSGYGMHIRGWNANDGIYTLEMYNNGSLTNAFYNSGRVLLGNVGNVGIGTASPGFKLHVNGDTMTEGWLRTSGNTGWYSQSYGGGWYMSDTTWIRSYGGKNVWMDQSAGVGGSFGVGTLSPGYRLHVMGDVYANGGWLRTSGDAGWYSETYGGGWHMTDSTWIRAYNGKSVYIAANLLVDGGSGVTAPNGFWYTSDKRLKKDIKDLDSGIETLLKFKPRNFTWKKSGKKDVGFIAQEIQSIDPKLVKTSDDEKKSLTIRTDGLLPYIVKAIQDLYAMIIGDRKEQEALRKEVAELRKENQALEARLQRQELALKRLEEKMDMKK